MGKIADSIIENGVIKGKIKSHVTRSMCLIGHAANCYTDLDLDLCKTETEWVWEELPLEVRDALRQSLPVPTTRKSSTPIWEFNDHEDTTDDEILQVGKLADEYLETHPIRNPIQ